MDVNDRPDHIAEAKQEVFRLMRDHSLQAGGHLLDSDFIHLKHTISDPQTQDSLLAGVQEMIDEGLLDLEDNTFTLTDKGSQILWG